MNIAALVSGGVDSSVALALLKQQGYNLRAFYLKIWLEDELAYLGNCPWQEDLSYLESVCSILQVPLEIVPLQKEYWEQVVSYTIAQVRIGNTPSPDLLCNQRIKFGCFVDRVGKDFDRIATGHYAQVHTDEQGTTHLLSAQDSIKDQTYFLAHLDQSQVGRLMFPIGHLYKKEVRELATSFNLPNQTRKDSYGICFLGKIPFDQFIKHHLGTKQGPLIEFETGKIMGQHEGFWFYTIGQRKGIGLSGGPWFVVAKNTEENLVYISRQYHEPDKVRDHFTVNNLHWITGYAPQIRELEVKVRHGQTRYPCTLQINGTVATVQLKQNDQGLAPGQFAVFYDGNECLGCGVIG